MTNNFKNHIDTTDIKIIKQLQINARIAFTQLGKIVGLTSPAVSERIKKLEDRGIISGYSVQLDQSKIGAPVSAFIALTTKSNHYDQLIDFAEKSPEILECHHLTGSISFMIKVAVSSPSTLENLLTKLNKFGETQTTIILSTPIKK